ncbi:MAG: hypothetical protein HY835_11150 [Anaerolineae bacterium]|nr:hypothetical protein [Anaerolineae bacterium]
MQNLLISRKFWSLILALTVMVVAAFYPAFQMDAEAGAGMLVIVVSYIIGVGLDPGENAGTWQGVIKSRKFWAAAIGFTVMVLAGLDIKLPQPFSPDMLIEVAVLIGSYVVGIAASDRLRIRGSYDG